MNKPTIRQQTIKALEYNHGIDLKTATDEEIVTFMEYFKLNGVAELYKQLRVYEK